MKDKIKEDFINSFGKEKWEELETLKPLQDAVDLVCKEYLGIETIPVVFETLSEDISRYDFKLKAIVLNTKYKNDYVELLDSCMQEPEHHLQRIYICSNATPKAKRWKNEFKHYDKFNQAQKIEIVTRFIL